MKHITLAILLFLTSLITNSELVAKKIEQDKDRTKLKEFVLDLQKAAKDREVSWFVKRTVFPAYLEFDCGSKTEKVGDKVFLQVILADEYRNMGMKASARKAELLDKNEKTNPKVKDVFVYAPSASKIYFVSSPNTKGKLGYYVAKIDSKFKIIGVHKCDE